MRKILLLTLVLLVAAAAAIATRPDQAKLETDIADAFLARVAKADVGEADNPVDAAILIGCKLRPGDCRALLTKALDIEVDRGLLYTRARVADAKTETSCFGVFGRFFCGNGLLDH